MEKKNSLFVRYMKYWYGITGPLDEHKRAEMEHIGNVAFFMMFLLIIPFFLASEIVFYNSTAANAYFVLSLGLGIAFIGACFYVMFASRKVQLTENEVKKSELPQAKKGAWIKGLISGLIWGICMLMINSLSSDANPWISIPIWLIGGLFFGLTIAAVNISRIKIIKDQD